MALSPNSNAISIEALPKAKNHSKMDEVDILWCEHSFANLNISLVALNLKISLFRCKTKKRRRRKLVC